MSANKPGSNVSVMFLTRMKIKFKITSDQEY